MGTLLKTNPNLKRSLKLIPNLILSSEAAHVV
jgi:hypothetical protein